jgi:anti-sigma regulatory factor (Ser/Thr protein kinase)
MREALDHVLESLHTSDQQATDIRLALTEACTNAVQHAYPDDAPGDMVITFQRSPSALTVTVLDHGRGIDAPPRHAGLGLGLPVIDAAADSLAITNLQPGTSVRMTFSR